MEKIKDYIKEYLLTTIQTKHNMRKRIYKLEEELKEAHKNEQYAIQQKEIYKAKLKKIKDKKKENK